MPDTAPTADADRLRRRVLLVVSVIVLVGALALGLQLAPIDRTTIWLEILVLVAITSTATIALTLRQRLDAAGVVLLIGLSAALLVGPAVSHDLGTTLYWLGPFCAVGLVVSSRGRAWVVAVIAGVLAVALLALAPPSGYLQPTYFDELLAGSLVSILTAALVAYGLWERQRSLASAMRLALVADALLSERQSVHQQLEQRVAERERALALVLADQETLIESLTDMAVRDPRTGLFNGRHHKRHWSQVVDESRATGLPVAVVALDLDLFGRVNRDYSHAAGDSVLEEFAAIVRRLIRPGDIPYRLGQGEEFVVLLPHTRKDEALGVAERIRVACRKQVFTELHADDRLTVSAGVADRAPDSDERWVDVLGRADAALRRAKAAGRDRVVVDGDVA